MIWMVIVFLCIVEFFAWYRYRDLICPAVLHNILWIVSLFGAMSFGLESIMDPWAIAIICAGAVIFQMGFSFSLKATLCYRKKLVGYNYDVNRHMIKVLVIVVALASLPSIYQYYGYLRLSGGEIYSLLTSADENLSLPVYFSHYRKIVEYLSLAFLTIFWKMDKEKRKSIRKYVMLLYIIAAVFVATVPTRNGILSYLLPLLILYISTHPMRNRTIILYAVVSIATFMGIYYIISLGKYWYLYDSGSSPLKVLGDEIKVYLSGSMIAFGNTFRDHTYMYGGKNTFRFFMAIGDAFFGSSSALKLTNEFVFLPGFSTNVFTFYDFYLRDFGVGYALVAQFLVSCIHGMSYKWMVRGNAFQIYMFSLLSYPLVMQFFQDQYVSLMSTWIQAVIVGVIVLETRLFILKEPVDYENTIS